MRNWVAIVAVGMAVGGCGQQEAIEAKSGERGAGEARTQAAGGGEQVRVVSVPALKRVVAAAGAARGVGAGDPQAGVVKARIEQVLQYVRGKEFELAERGLEALERQKVGWSAATQQECGPKVERAREALRAGRGEGKRS